MKNKNLNLTEKQKEAYRKFENLYCWLRKCNTEPLFTDFYYIMRDWMRLYREVINIEDCCSVLYSNHGQEEYYEETIELMVGMYNHIIHYYELSKKFSAYEKIKREIHPGKSFIQKIKHFIV